MGRFSRLLPSLIAAGLLWATITTGLTAAAPASTSSGERLWAAQYNGSGNRNDFAAALGLSPDGSTVFVTGSSFIAGSREDYATIAYDSATGTELWASFYDGPGDFYDSDYAQALGVSPGGSMVFVTGQSDGGAPSSSDYATIAYDAATGAELWASRYNGPHDDTDSARALGVSADGSTVFVTGYSDEGEADENYATVAYEAATGNQLWASRYDGPLHSSDIAWALGTSPDSSMVYVTGESATIAYDATTGTRVWIARYMDLDDQALALGVSPDGSAVFVTGTDGGYATMAYDAATGAKLWHSRFDGPGNGTDVAYALETSPDGSAVFVTGVSDLFGPSDFATIAYDTATGAELWASRYDGPANGSDFASDLGASPDGSAVFVTGSSDVDADSTDYATIAYDMETGAKMWRRLDGRQKYDGASALGVSPDGSTVYVTGRLQAKWISGRFDYATMAFAA
jgi:outer membrane protein assembly factor BamB